MINVCIMKYLILAGVNIIIFLFGKILGASDPMAPPWFFHFPEDGSPPRCSPPCWMRARERVENIRYACGCILGAAAAARSSDRRGGVGSRQDISRDASAGARPGLHHLWKDMEKIKSWAELTAGCSHRSRCLRPGPRSDLILGGWLWWSPFFFSGGIMQIFMYELVGS